ncbi:glucosamine-6-phosphate deaminase [Corynebacterium sp. CNCTC7651]|uniref:glucosamine-6-phosphate deaminase n=1 Tax=Corynebacterium sp. CNCTC7651 TaxID=2815361 RepID=UPI001F2CBCC4|nr:glucosamine-6-phosphate deaminase [Corynebacterium sp. CNCTC7651]UIZ91405.1 glucosamine-6-phosphate deaminase [Corynebacterium sp. CNCTC7651]
MRIIIHPTPKDAGRAAADIIEPFVREGATLGLATGSTPTPTYQELIRRHTEDGLSFADSKAFLLDEYVGLPKEHEQSYYATIRRELTSHIDITDADVRSLDGSAADAATAAADYEQAIKDAGGVDIQILGIGANGHIAFNEPGSPHNSRTRVIDLHPQTIADNARFFESEDEVPRQALTQGIGTIMEAKHLILIATGANKADAVKALVEGPVTEDSPASAIQNHPNVTEVQDDAAASKLTQ